MGTTNDAATPSGTNQSVSPVWLVVLKRAAIWGVFLGLMYLTRDFFFLIFMTFMFSYIALAAVGGIMKRLSPGRDRHAIRSMVTLAVFMTTLLVMVGLGALIMPRLLAQGQSLAGWMSQVSPETEVAHLLAGYVGPSEFRRQYGD